MEGQQIHDWDDRYQQDSPPPWEDLEPHTEFCQFVLRHLDPTLPSLEVGSGLGHNAVYLAQQGLSLTASDISPSAVQQIQSLAHDRGLALPAKVVDVTETSHLKHAFAGVMDKGCFHSFFSQKSRVEFVQCIHQLLTDDGVWVSSIGSADHSDDPNDPWIETYPRLTLTEIVSLVEPAFEVLEVRTGYYGRTDDRQFKTWECAFRKRNQVLRK